MMLLRWPAVALVSFVWTVVISVMRGALTAHHHHDHDHDGSSSSGGPGGMVDGGAALAASAASAVAASAGAKMPLVSMAEVHR